LAESPAHKFGQSIGIILEEIIESELRKFCNPRGLYLDKLGVRKARPGKKVTWEDKYGAIHDLDFVIEKHGTDKAHGRPVAFIEAAWRRYTKHSKNKAQEIQGAVLPIFEKHHRDYPFLGVALAGIFTSSAINQLKSTGFKVLYFEYNTITESFRRSGLNVCFDEDTPDKIFSDANSFIERMTPSKRDKLKHYLIQSNKSGFDKFFEELSESLDRIISQIIIIPLHGNEKIFSSPGDAVQFLNDYNESSNEGKFRHYEIRVSYSNGDEIKATFNTKNSVKDFLNYVTGY